MDENTIIAMFCAKLKALRLSNGLTLEDLGEMSGVSISTLSKIENRQQKPTFETVLRVARALHINFVQMLESPSRPLHKARRSITRASEVPLLQAEHYDYHNHAADITHKAAVPAVMRIKTHELPPAEQWSTHEGEEFIYVLEGRLAFHTEEYAPAILNKGDSCYLDSTMRHAFVSEGEEDAVVLSVFLSVPATAAKFNEKTSTIQLFSCQRP